MSDTSSYFATLLKPNGRKPAGRKVWSIDLETILLPFFFATNTTGDTHLPSDALGCPLRLAYTPDGSVRFSKAGRPITKVAKELADTIRMMRENFSAGLLGYTEQVIARDKSGYKAQVESARKAGEPISSRDRANLDKALAEIMAEQVAKAEAEAEAKATERERDKVPVVA